MAIQFDIQEWQDGLTTALALRPVVDSALKAAPGSRLFIEYKGTNDKFMYIPGLNQVYPGSGVKSDVRVLVGLPKKQIIKTALYRGAPYVVSSLIGFSFGVLFSRLLEAIEHRRLEE
ncbi:hypothetical protein J7L13_03160 [bacterium]|nr:hypothetical protein [bacterium]